jgi:hypothetical protein
VLCADLKRRLRDHPKALTDSSDTSGNKNRILKTSARGLTKSCVNQRCVKCQGTAAGTSKWPKNQCGDGDCNYPTLSASTHDCFSSAISFLQLLFLRIARVATMIAAQGPMTHLNSEDAILSPPTARRLGRFDGSRRKKIPRVAERREERNAHAAVRHRISSPWDAQARNRESQAIHGRT